MEFKINKTRVERFWSQPMGLESLRVFYWQIYGPMLTIDQYTSLN